MSVASQIVLPRKLSAILQGLRALDVHVETTQTPQIGATPFFFHAVYALDQLPRDLTELYAPLPLSQKQQVLDVPLSGYGQDGASTSLVIYAAPPLMVTFEYFCPEYCDNETDANGTLTVDWTPSRTLFPSLRTHVLSEAQTRILEALFTPFTDHVASLITPSVDPLTPRVLAHSLQRALTNSTLPPAFLRETLAQLATLSARTSP